MRSLLLFLVVVMVTACSSREEKSDTQAGTATETVSADVIGGDMGYIVENARLTPEGEQAELNIKGGMQLSSGESQVLVIRTQSEEGGFTEWLALQYPAFSTGARLEYAAGDDRTAFWVFGIAGDQEVIRRTGTVEGNIRFIKQEPAENSLGLNRNVTNGVGEIEVVVMGIDNADIPVQSEKKYAARFRLPIITLGELARINQPI